MQTKNEVNKIRSAIEKIKASGSLGRSPTYIKLLDHLADASEKGIVCSEVSLAADVFNRSDDFDVTSDSTVRVYIHNLRQKLDLYYESAGSNDDFRLNIPKGSYRLVVEQRSTPKKLDAPDPKPEVGLALKYSALGFGIALLILGSAYFLFNSKQNIENTEQQLLFWGGILSDDKPVMIVIGDYYIFGESTDDGDMRLVREFDINSPADLQLSLEKQNSSDLTRFDMDLTYLPRGSAFALSNIYEIFTQTGKEPRVTLMSELDAADLQTNHIVYLGYLSGLGVLESYTFSASKFDIGFSYDQVYDSETRQTYTSNLIDAREDRNFVDYGVLASYANDKGNKVIVIAGTRDAGLMEMSDIAAQPNVMQLMGLEDEASDSVLGVFEVYGFNLTNISSSLVSSELLELEKIWVQ